MRIRTIGPLKAPLTLRSGLDPRSAAFARVLRALPSENGEVVVPNRSRAARQANFAATAKDDLDLRLLVWRPKPADGEPRLTCHVFPTGIAVIEAEFDISSPASADDLETYAQAETRAAFDRHAKAFGALLAGIRRALPTDLVDPAPREPLTGDAFCWIGRAIVLSEAERRDPANASLVRQWLSGTARPEEADAILSGGLDVSMTWLNYVVVDGAAADTAFAATRTAQFFYAAQDALNLSAQDALHDAETGRAFRETEAGLIEQRRRMQSLRILYDQQKGFLSRARRARFDDLMTLWDFDVLMENGERIVEATTARIGEIANRRARRSAFVTDIILAGIALFTVIELCLHFIEYSREVMSRPALGYTDSEVSWILSIVAAWDTDLVLLGGAAAFAALIGIYALSKNRS